MVDGPDFGQYLSTINRNNDPSYVPIGELFVEGPIIRAIADDDIEYDDHGMTQAGMRVYFETHRDLGYDAVTVGVGPGFALPEWAITDDVAPLSKGKRGYITGAATRIWDRESFEAYPWPSPEQVSYVPLERAAEAMPEGMAILASAGGPCEWLMWIVGYEALSFMLADDPELVAEIMARIEEQMLAVFAAMASMERVGAVWISDDMGFKTGTFLSPDHMRTYVLPTQRRLARVAHDAGRPVLLHSCGNLSAIMDDLIDDVGIDAKHSFEDAITPVTEAKELWGDRACLIGGVDVDPLTRLSPDEVHAYTLGILDRCAPNGGYILGSGNSVANYVPVDNYLAMLRAWRDWHAARRS
ncbi:MAG: hypothetical protein GF320_01625 [Armatimonadia bacterium]|nr:hypothetical protein [Armatimonadia bacterium]